MKENAQTDREIGRATSALLTTLQDYLESSANQGTELSAAIPRLLEHLPKLSLDPDRPGPRELPVCRHLGQALDLGESGPARNLASIIRQLQASLTWQQSASHTLELRGAEFMDNYAFCDFGLIGSTRLYVGVILLGPGITYPVNSYPSEGIFLVIGGSPEWKSGDSGWREVAAGDLIYRPRDGAEGKRPGKKPLLALYAWLYA